MRKISHPCNALDPDLSSAQRGKLQTDEHRYPADQLRDAFNHPSRRKGALATLHIFGMPSVPFSIDAVAFLLYNDSTVGTPLRG